MKPSAERILDYLRRNRHRSVSAPELCDRCYSLDYRKRISELRHGGYVIIGDRVPGKPYNSYQLVMEPQ